MSQPFLTVSAAGLRPAGITLSTAEAVACLILVGDALDWAVDAPDPSRVVLRGDGRVDVTAISDTTPARVETYARLLHRLLPDATHDVPARVPGALRLAVARGLGVLDAPPFSSARDFRKAIERFVTDPPEQLVVAVMVRWAEAMGSQSEERPRERRLAGPRVDVLRRMLREADLERYALLHEAAGVRREGVARTWTSPQPQPGAASGADDLGRSRIASLGTLRSFESATDRTRPARSAVAASTVYRRAPRLATAGLVVVAIALAGAAAVRQYPGEILPDVAPPAPPPPAARSERPVMAPTPEVVPDASTPEVVPDASTPEAVPEVSRPEVAIGPSLPDLPSRASAANPQRSDRTAGTAGSPPRQGTAAEHEAEDRVVPSSGTAEPTARRSLGPGAGFQLATVVDGSHRATNVSLSPDGTRVAFDSDRAGEPGVYVADRNGGNVRRISGPGSASAAAWTPDGRGLAYLRAESGLPQVRNLWLHDLESGSERRLTSYRYGEISPASWFADGRRLSYGQTDRLHVMDTQSGASRSYDSPVPGRRIVAVAASPDGRHVIFQVEDDGAWLLELRDGSMRRVLDDPTAQRLVWSPSGDAVAYYSGAADQWKVWVRAPGPES